MDLLTETLILETIFLIFLVVEQLVPAVLSFFSFFFFFLQYFREVHLETGCLSTSCVPKGIKMSCLPTQFWWPVVSGNLGVHESSEGVYLCNLSGHGLCLLHFVCSARHRVLEGTLSKYLFLNE